MSIILVTLTSIIGILINLKYPKMNASSDTEVVKQSISSMISVFIGMGIFIVSAIFILYFYDSMNIYLLLSIHVFVLFITMIVLYIILMNKGIREYKNINV